MKQTPSKKRNQINLDDSDSDEDYQSNKRNNLEAIKEVMDLPDNMVGKSA